METVADSEAHQVEAGWKAIALSAWKEATSDNIGLVAAGVAFYAFLALVPLIASVVLIYGLVVDPETVARHIAALADMLPASAAELVGGQVESVAESNSGAQGLGLLLALAIALFGARNGAGSVVTALNIAYDEADERGFIRSNILALALTVAAALAGIGAVGVQTLIAALPDLIPEMPGGLVFLSNIVSYALLFAFAAIGAALLYRIAPDRPMPGWRALMPGALLAAAGWTALTIGFGYYVANFGSYNATYGSLGAVVVLLTWLYLSAYILLLGAELNAAAERSRAPR